MTISNDRTDNERLAQQPDWASAPANDPDHPVGDATEQVYADRDQQSVGDPGSDGRPTAPATDEGWAPLPDQVTDDRAGSVAPSENGATAAESLNGTVGSERHAAPERAATDSAIGAEQAAVSEPTRSEPVSDPARGAATASAARGDGAVSDSLFEGDLTGLRARWNDVQAAFVDDPRDCVQQADGLVSDVVQQLTANFSQARTRLEEQWDRGEEASTEDLRVALQGYRQFFERLLSV